MAIRAGCALLLALLLGGVAPSQSFSDFIIRVNIAPDVQRNALVDSFLNAHDTWPLAEQDTLLHFVFRGPATDVSLAGDMNQWTPAGSPLQRLSTTTLWYRTESYETDARLDYKFVVDGNWLLDPKNPRTCSGGFGPNSELRMPGYPEQPELLRDPAVPRGSLLDTTLAGAGIASRVLRVYIPAGYDTLGAACPLVLVHDGLDYLALGGMDIILDNLIAQHRIPPVIAVFVPAVDRASEYAGAKMPSYGAWIVNTVLQWADARFRTRRDAAGRAVVGCSDGGNISLYLGFTYPEQIGNVAAQSSNVVASIAAAANDGPKLALRLSLDLGTYDIPVLVPRVEQLVASLQAKGYDFRFRRVHEGHSWGNWRAHIDEALIYFFGIAASKHGAAQPSSHRAVARRGTHIGDISHGPERNATRHRRFPRSAAHCAGRGFTRQEAFQQARA